MAVLSASETKEAQAEAAEQRTSSRVEYTAFGVQKGLFSHTPIIQSRRGGVFLIMSDNLTIYIVRNHQDGYPYINLSQFFFWKYTETLIFWGKFIGQ